VLVVTILLSSPCVKLGIAVTMVEYINMRLCVPACVYSACEDSNFIIHHALF
jgi:hypothetical protein